MSRKDYLKRELQALYPTFGPPANTVERVASGVCFTKYELGCVDRANLRELPDPKFSVTLVPLDR